MMINLVWFQAMDVTMATKNVRRDRGKAMKELVFQAEVPALGFNTYMIAKQTNSKITLWHITFETCDNEYQVSRKKDDSS